MKKLLIINLILILAVMTGCGKKDDTQQNITLNESVNKTDEDMFTERDYESTYSEQEAVVIQLNGDTAVASSDSVVIEGSVITITENKTHIISGTLNDGMILVEAGEDAKLQLVFQNVHITSSDSAPLYIKEADKVFLTLAEGSENSLTNGGNFISTEESNLDGALFSKQDLTVNGAGSLNISSPAGHGIVCKDDLVFTGGNYEISASGHGLDANDSIRICNASFTINADQDGIHAENSDDETLGYIYISSGNLTIESEDDGIYAGASMMIHGGTFSITSVDDAVHAEDTLFVQDGKIDILSS